MTIKKKISMLTSYDYTLAGIVDKSGAWISYNSQRIGQGRENAKVFLRENPELANEIESAIRQNAGLVGDQLLDNSIADSEARILTIIEKVRFYQSVA